MLFHSKLQIILKRNILFSSEYLQLKEGKNIEENDKIQLLFMKNLLNKTI